MNIGRFFGKKYLKIADRRAGAVRRLLCVCIASLTAISLTGCGTQERGNTQKTSTDPKFTPSLDTEVSTSIEIAGFMANFEALDQVVNDFNKYYPNVTVTYEQNDANSLPDYLTNNGYIDVFMTNAANVSPDGDDSNSVLDLCLDLAGEDMDVSAIDPKLIESCTVEGKLVRIPLAKMMCGMVVNKSLLQKEGLELPETYSEFLDVCDKLKQKGYTPIQSSKYHACSDLILPMALGVLANDSALISKVQSGDPSYAESLRPVYEKLDTLISKGYMSDKVNETYPDDNYDGAILAFFDGDVPFWIANTESVSGMKKRESKSEHFSAEPFDYEFVNVPLGDVGVYDYEEPWYGFSVNKNGDNVDYAVEFMRFLSREEELNKLAEVKGMPSVTIDNNDVRFNDALYPDKCEGRYVADGLLSDVNGLICDTANKMGYGEITTVDEAIEMLRCK